MNRAMKFLIGSIMGGIIGATAAILLAPGSGDETRTAIKYRIEQLTTEFKSAMQERKEELEAELRQYKQLD
jgi:gas vesicle protein